MKAAGRRGRDWRRLGSSLYFVNKEICLNGNQQWGCSFPPLRSLSSSGPAPIPERDTCEFCGQGLASTWGEGPLWLHPSLPAGGSRAAPWCCPFPALIPGTERRLLSPTVETRSCRKRTCSWAGWGLHTLAELLSLSEPQVAHLYHASLRAFLRIRWEGTTGWPGGRVPGPCPLLSLHFWSGSGGEWRRPLGHIASKWAKMQIGHSEL